MAGDPTGVCSGAVVNDPVGAGGVGNDSGLASGLGVGEIELGAIVGLGEDKGSDGCTSASWLDEGAGDGAIDDSTVGVIVGVAVAAPDGAGLDSAVGLGALSFLGSDRSNGASEGVVGANGAGLGLAPGDGSGAGRVRASSTMDACIGCLNPEDKWAR